MKPNLLLIPILTFLTAAFGSWLTNRGMSWYQSINLPGWTPPGSVIGTVWTVIFILAMISVLIIWNRYFTEKNFWLIILFFIINALLNVGWSYLFFSLNLIGPAVFEAGLLGLSVLALIILIWPYSLTAAILLLPYFGWVCFATYLTYQVWLLNK